VAGSQTGSNGGGSHEEMERGSKGAHSTVVSLLVRMLFYNVQILVAASGLPYLNRWE
jgi:hypothetical protein